MRIPLGTVLISFALAAAAGCITGQALYLPGGLARPVPKGPAPAAAGATVAVVDFARSPSISEEIGRDYDHVRAIRWRGSPGKTIADLVAGALAEKGYKVLRVPDGNSVPADAAIRVWGTVDEFRVDAKRVKRVKAESAARVTATIYASGGGTPPGWNAAISSEYSYDDPFVTPEGVRSAMNGAANGVADEALRRLTAAGILPAPSPPRAE